MTSICRNTLVVCKIQAQKVLPKKTNKTSDHAEAEDNAAIAEAQLCMIDWENCFDFLIHGEEIRFSNFRLSHLRKFEESRGRMGPQTKPT